MQLQDQRHTTHALTYDELSPSEQDAYARLHSYFCQYRTCSNCGVTFSLRHSLANGTECKGACANLRPRDHVDFVHEKLEWLDALVVPYRLHLVLKSQNAWPQHRYIDKCTKQIMPNDTARQPESVCVQRTCFKSGFLQLPIFSDN